MDVLELLIADLEAKDLCESGPAPKYNSRAPSESADIAAGRLHSRVRFLVVTRKLSPLSSSPALMSAPRTTAGMEVQGSAGGLCLQGHSNDVHMGTGRQNLEGYARGSGKPAEHDEAVRKVQHSWILRPWNCVLGGHRGEPCAGAAPRGRRCMRLSATEAAAALGFRLHRDTLVCPGRKSGVCHGLRRDSHSALLQLASLLSIPACCDIGSGAQS
jgi:hypothetical protein